MKPLLQNNLISITFVVVLFLIGSSFATLLILDLTEKGRLAFILILISAFFTGVGLFIEILKRSKKENDVPKNP